MIEAPPAEMTRRLLFILHRGLVQVRNLALKSGDEQIAVLADALEIIPGLLDRWDDGHQELIRQILCDYKKKYPSGEIYDYLSYLEEVTIPDRF